MSGLVRYHVERGVATITLDSQHNRNALSGPLIAELLDLHSRALADASVRVIVLSHAGRVFCSGMDLRASRGDDPAAMPVTAFPALLRALWESTKPVLARIGGPARAGGIGLLCACDLAIAASSATFAFSEVRLGVVPAVISVTVLPRMLPRAAHELFLTGEVIDAARAVQVGLVNRVVADTELDAEVHRYAAMLIQGAPGALAATKQMLRRAPVPSMSEDFSAMTALSATHFASEEGQEGIAAFSAKRPPRWARID